MLDELVHGTLDNVDLGLELLCFVVYQAFLVFQMFHQPINFNAEGVDIIAKFFKIRPELISSARFGAVIEFLQKQ